MPLFSRHLAEANAHQGLAAKKSQALQPSGLTINVSKFAVNFFKKSPRDRSHTVPTITPLKNLWENFSENAQGKKRKILSPSTFVADLPRVASQPCNRLYGWLHSLRGVRYEKGFQKTSASGFFKGFVSTVLQPLKTERCRHEKSYELTIIRLTTPHYTEPGEQSAAWISATESYDLNMIPLSSRAERPAPILASYLSLGGNCSTQSQISSDKTTR